VEYADDVAGLLRPGPRALDVVMDPRRAFGQPAVRNVRTDSLAEGCRAGRSRGSRRADSGSVDEAIRFELIVGAERVA
jgi:hypothetical protein